MRSHADWLAGCYAVRVREFMQDRDLYQPAFDDAGIARKAERLREIVEAWQEVADLAEAEADGWRVSAEALARVTPQYEREALRS